MQILEYVSARPRGWRILWPPAWKRARLAAKVMNYALHRGVCLAPMPPPGPVRCGQLEPCPKHNARALPPSAMMARWIAEERLRRDF